MVSTPYINMTLNLMRYFGAKVDWRDEHTLEVLPAAYNAGQAFHVELRLSVEHRIGMNLWRYRLDKEACIHLPGLREDSGQGDSVVRKLLEPLGVKTTFTEEGITLTKTTPEGELMTDFTMCPDLSANARDDVCHAQAPVSFYGTAKPENQERPTIVALQNELAKLGRRGKPTTARCGNDGNETAPEAHPAIATYDDHRMAMAFPRRVPFPAKHLEIEHPEVVAKSYPAFWDDLKAIGTQITCTDNSLTE